MLLGLAIVLIRPASLMLSLPGTRFTRREKLIAAWFGPKGFASVVYGLLVLQAGIPQSEEAYTLIAVCIVFSIVAHSSTDVPIARLFHVDGPSDTTVPTARPRTRSRGRGAPQQRSALSVPPAARPNGRPKGCRQLFSSREGRSFT
ncbi:cation:proton antiporter domain-containing protein [Streptomyces longisporoflavus]|uniref:Cation:proton antiporter n=1 Tax=Streptomyces longisporoflavus TaxID=28044 RepID=A0ABW7QZL8_9ACTN